MRILAVLIPVFVAGMAGFFVATAERGGHEEFAEEQRDPRQLQASDVEAIVRTAPEPVGPRGPEGIRARCHPRGRGDLRNPWRCSVAYRSGLVAAYDVVVRPDGSYVGDYRGGSSSVTGCCVNVP